MEKIDLITAAQLRAAFTAFKDYVDGGQQAPVPPGPPRPEPEPEEPTEPTTPKAEYFDSRNWSVRDLRPYGWVDVFRFASSVASNPYIPGESITTENSLRFTVFEPIRMQVTPSQDTYGKLWVRRDADEWYTYDTSASPGNYSVTLEPGFYLLFTSEGGVVLRMHVSDFGGVPEL